MKYLQGKFSVSGGRDPKADQAYRDGWERIFGKKHWRDCALNHGGSECDMGPDCGQPPPEKGYEP